jgi:hypothetical protein
MNSKKVTIERRREKRLKAAGGAYAVVGPHINKLGQIKDISRGGLAFKYLATEVKPDSSDVIDVFISKNDFYMQQIPVTTVSDFELKKEDPFSTVTLRQQSVQFGELTEDQSDQLKYLLQHHTVGEI